MLLGCFEAGQDALRHTFDEVRPADVAADVVCVSLILVWQGSESVTSRA